MNKDIEIIHDAELKSQNKISALIEVITDLKQPLNSARQRGKDVVFINADDYDFLIDQLLGLTGSLSGDLTNAYSTIKLQAKNNAIHERVEDAQVSKITSELWVLIERGMNKYRSEQKNTKHLTVAR